MYCINIYLHIHIFIYFAYTLESAIIANEYIILKNFVLREQEGDV